MSRPQLQGSLDFPILATDADAPPAGFWRLFFKDGGVYIKASNGSVRGPFVSVPAGTVWETARATADEGWLLCDGAFLLRSAYPDLFAAIGTTYNLPGDTDVTRFRIPNVKGKVVVGLDAADTAFNALGKTGGSKTTTAPHTHGYSHTHSTTVVSTNHAHNVYARNQDTGWTSHDHDHGCNAPWNAGGNIGLVPGGNQYNLNHWWGRTHGQGSNHYHNFNHDHPSTNYQNEAPWAGNWQHEHTTDSQSATTTGDSSTTAANGNLQPYIVFNYMIKT